MADTIIGIDLGTTNSAAAAYIDGKVHLLGPKNAWLLPSVAGLSPDDKLLVGEPARNQMVLYPERTIRSIKRRMGTEEKVTLGGHEYTPAEVSSLILRELVTRVGHHHGMPVRKAVITVPAYFSDAQRQATREAGALAGLEVLRILNEPTAASFAYGYGLEDDAPHNLLVYDLGGGTFDISVVRIEGDVTEVLATTGDNHLGGDDFDALLRDHLAGKFQQATGIKLDGGKDTRAWARLLWAAEQAKIALSTETRVAVREEALAEAEGVIHHLDVTITRAEFEELIEDHLRRTVRMAAEAIEESSIAREDIDAVLLVGGATRTPRVRELLSTEIGLEIREDIHPDLAVALGAGVQASRLSGHDVSKILVDITPYSFGIAHMETIDGIGIPDRYRPTIPKNSPVPAIRSQAYYTAAPYQKVVEIKIFQGENKDANENIFLGTFKVEDLTPKPTPVSIQVRMALDINGILSVTATEEETGLKKGITIKDAMAPRSEEEIAEARRRMEELFASRDGADEPDPGPPMPAAGDAVTADADALLEKLVQFIGEMDPEDREEAAALKGEILEGIGQGDREVAEEAMAALRELLYYIEHR